MGIENNTEVRNDTYSNPFVPEAVGELEAPPATMNSTPVTPVVTTSQVEPGAVRNAVVRDLVAGDAGVLFNEDFAALVDMSIDAAMMRKGVDSTRDLIASPQNRNEIAETAWAAIASGDWSITIEKTDSGPTPVYPIRFDATREYLGSVRGFVEDRMNEQNAKIAATQADPQRRDAAVRLIAENLERFVELDVPVSNTGNMYGGVERNHYEPMTSTWARAKMWWFRNNLIASAR